ncbi:nucleoid occlusion protein [Anoxybacillus rupiensis]|jgi:ParB family transcriptional regulator, chromosome partitioning protein|uniref:Nucleoid occlusion protein n=1 Tax=Anoxybacteroides rupiense TaxID=311460 RepID=A0ABD5IQV2_9BACL|nr:MULTISPECIES: nucleoid occlusion protein [Anoxybacillus]KXG08629.1 Nucleoid occlusion protein [Anoxybacillus sp. P3H1B]MBB3908188.1 ParB family chromosome partitioning protein [Anoxybacillus rupiensis]MBS2772315.1 nucleoid occlusion protein [Anoxybacillus rupiensis]MDE8563995.1 nucleoid occlusion protein [Anoxybacillus rupiensis]MED5050263.1 nucleoid occlusion protein [Anoxybacillus rupiensis]
MKHPFSRFFSFGEKEQEEMIEKHENEEVRKIPVSQIVPNRFQPRTIFDDEKIAELALTIRTHGIIQPIVVRECENGKYEIIAGERRWRAVQTLGWTEIPAIIKNLNDKETASVALIENLQREELTPIEEALAYAKLLELHHLTQEALAQRLGKGQSTIANKLRLLKLPQEVQEALLQRTITERHARALIVLKDRDKQLQLLKEIIEKQLNVKQTEDRVLKILEANRPKPKPKRKAFSKDMRIAVNTIRQSLAMVADNGLSIDSEEEDFEDYYQITIRIPKK